MKNKNELVLASEVEAVRQCFAHWREQNPGRRALPKGLWSAAANLARRHGVHRIAQALGLNYYSLQERMQSAKGERQPPPPAPSFVELMPSSLGSISECSLEVENAQGSRMKIQLRGAATGELSGLTQLLWRGL